MSHPAQTEEPCPFCEIIAGRAPATVVREWPDAIAITPLDPFVLGHVLVIPKKHVADHAADPDTTAVAARRFAELSRDLGHTDNMISNRGRPATQSVFHLHLHYIPRATNDGVALPWYSGRTKKNESAA